MAFERKGILVKTVIFICRGGHKGIANVETYRDIQGHTRTERDRQGQTGTDRDRQGQEGTSMDRQGQTCPVPALSLLVPALSLLVSALSLPLTGIIGK